MRCGDATYQGAAAVTGPVHNGVAAGLHHRLLPARTVTIHYTSGGEVEVPPEERELVRARLEAALDADWPSYIVEALAGAQLAT